MLDSALFVQKKFALTVEDVLVTWDPKKPGRGKGLSSEDCKAFEIFSNTGLELHLEEGENSKKLSARTSC